MKLKIGFTGTRQGMTKEQKESFMGVIEKLKPSIFIHGDCIGADMDGHNAVRASKMKTSIISFPPKKRTLRAFCQADFVNVPDEYLKRNKNIVDQSNLLIAIPRGFREDLRSGTWSTIRYAKKKRKAIIFIFPDGKVVENN